MSTLDRIFTWFERSNDAFPHEPPERPPGRLWPFVVHYTRPFRAMVTVTAIVGMTIAVLEVFLYAFMGNLVDWLTSADRDTFWSTHGTTLIIIAVLVLFVMPLLKFLNETVIHQGLLGNFAMRIRWQGHRYLLRQSVSFFQDDFAGRLAAKVMQTSTSVRDTVLKLVEVFLYVTVYFTAATVVFAASDIRLTAPMIVWLAAYVGVLYYFIPRLERISMAQADHRSLVTGRIVDSYTNIYTVKMFADDGREDAYAREGMSDFLANVHQQMRMSNMLICILHTLNACLTVSVTGLAIWLWSINAVSAGAIAVSIGLVLRLDGMSQYILFEVWALFENIGVVQDGLQTLSRRRTVTDVPDARTLSVTRGEIAYDGICFNYGKHSTNNAPGVISGLSLTVGAGEKIGLVGRSGAGKSTLVNLLLRLHDLDGGRIMIDGCDITGVTQDSLRGSIGMVTQDTSLLHRSIMENIRYGRPGASDEDVIEAAKKAEAHAFIVDLEDMSGGTGYAAKAGERGVKLSGGQRQRIAIARVLLKNAPILVLDEATSALDSEAEAAIQENLHALMEGKTVIAIAHRLSTIAAMDRLVVMEHGRIVEEGNHEDLIAAGGLYAGLWARQSGGFLVR